MAKELKDWIDEFVENGANPKDVTNWPEEAGGTGGSELYTYYVKTEDTDYGLYTFTFQCDNPELDSYNKLAQYLLSKGYYEHTDEGSNLQYATPILGVTLDRTSSGRIITGLFANQGEQLWIKGMELYISSGDLYTGVVSLKSDTFEITLVTE